MLCSKILKKWLISFKCNKYIIQEENNQIIFDFMRMIFLKQYKSIFNWSVILVETYYLK